VHAKGQELLTLAEAAAYLRVHRRTMTRLLRQGVVPGVKIGRQWRVRKADLEALLARTSEASGSKSSVRAAVRAEASSG
jgi:excisionase family DNA binding protein